MTRTYNIFEHGNRDIRADFHLHTLADPLGIVYKEDEGTFFSNYLDRLEEFKINFGLITNHNQFYLEEFKELRKKALKKEIYLIPGVELNVQGGANGIHILIAFNYEQWIDNNKGINDIETFLRRTFGPKQITPDQSTNENLIRTIETLNSYEKDYFIILAHVDRDNGFFEETDRGSRERDFYSNPLFRQHVVGFQKLESEKSKEELIQVFGSDELPAFVDGSDPKEINHIGERGAETYLKIGDFNFEAVKYALLDHIYRVASKIPEIKNAYIKQVSFTGGKLDGKTIHLNSNMNNLIGIRGSGKSTILETIRYAIDIPLGKTAKDVEYKQSLVYNLLGSGGKITLEIVDKHSKLYRVERIYGERPEVFSEDIRIPDLKINNGIIKALYFGQKDLSEIGEKGFSEDIIEKFFGQKAVTVRDKIYEKKQEIVDTIREIKDIRKLLTKKEELQAEKAAIIERLKIFEKEKINEKLKKQVNFNKDASKIKEIIDFETSIVKAFNITISEYYAGFEILFAYQSAENRELFEKVSMSLKSFHRKFNQIIEIVSNSKEDILQLQEYGNDFEKLNDRLKEEFAEIKRMIKLTYVNPDDYVKDSNKLNTVELKLSELNKKSDKMALLNNRLATNLTDLKQLWHEEYTILKKEIESVNQKGLSIFIDIKFKEDEDVFAAFMENNLKGTGIQKNNIRKIAKTYQDTVEIYYDLYIDSELSRILSGGNQLLKFRENFEDNLESYLTFRVPDKYILYYKKQELRKHSLGQRASAVILFILTKEDNDLIIIDQPEDDLDNQSIYMDVIKELQQLKQKTQFIFATHNPNIPVLGDCEQVISCKYFEESLNTVIGSIDCKDIQDEIVNIMEGGEEAFYRRNQIYKIWKH